MITWPTMLWKCPMQHKSSMLNFIEIGSGLWQFSPIKYKFEQKKFKACHVQKCMANKNYHLTDPETKTGKLSMLIYVFLTSEFYNLLHSNTLHILTTTAINVTFVIHSRRKRIIFPLLLCKTITPTANFIPNKMYFYAKSLTEIQQQFVSKMFSIIQYCHLANDE